MRNHLNLHVRAFGQRGDLNGRTRRTIGGEIFCVYLVHAGEIREIGQIDRAFDDMGKGQFLVVQDGLDVLQRAFGLRFDVAGNQIAIGRINRDLPGAEQEVADAHGMVIRPDGCR